MQTRSTEALSHAYSSFYQGLASGSQRGGNVPAFKGARYQYGDGRGTIFQGFMRTVIPIVAPVAALAAARFASETISGLRQGKKLSAAARAALNPAGETLLTGALASLNPPKTLGQKGSGRKRTASGVFATPGKMARRQGHKRKSTSSGRVYKGAKKAKLSHPRKSKKSKSNSKKSKTTLPLKQKKYIAKLEKSNF